MAVAEDAKEESVKQFEQLGVCKQLAEAAVSLGWKSPTSIQEQAVPHLLGGMSGHISLISMLKYVVKLICRLPLDVKSTRLSPAWHRQGCYWPRTDRLRQDRRLCPPYPAGAQAAIYSPACTCVSVGDVYATGVLPCSLHAPGVASQYSMQQYQLLLSDSQCSVPPRQCSSVYTHLCMTGYTPPPQDLLERPQALFALVLSPTRELAIQIAEQFEALGAGIGVRSAVLVGGIQMMAQVWRPRMHRQGRLSPVDSG